MADYRTLTALFRRTAKWYPDERAFVQTDGEQSYTYDEANDEACRFANALADAGVGKGDRVAFLSRARVDHAIGYLGAQKRGAVPTTLHSRESVGEITAMVRDADPAALVFQGRFADVAASIRADVDGIETWLTLEDGTGVPAFADPFSAFVAPAPATEPDVTIDPRDPGVIAFSSGSTGEPKGVVHTHECLAQSCLLGLYFYEVRDSDTALFALSPSFIAWQDQVLSWIAIGATVLFRETFDEAVVLDLIEDRGVTSLTLVPVHWRRLLDAGLAERDVDSLRVAGYSGAAIGEETLSRLVDLVPDAVYTAYGSTETLNTVTKLTPERVDPDRPGKLGRPITAVDVRIVEPGSRDPSAELDRGEIGEIAMTGPCVATEIWRDEVATERAFAEGWWFSGDLGRIGDDDNLYLEGRADNMIVSGGINIYPARIESVLGTHEGVDGVAVVGTPHEEWGEAVTACIAPSDDAADLDADALGAWCRSHPGLSDYQRPRRYEFVDELPTTGTDKVDYEALRDRFGAQ
jgi:fatty-acyl-CoA synthase